MVASTKPRTFIQLLDEYKTRLEYTKTDYAVILGIIRYHYTQQQMGLVSKVGFHANNTIAPIIQPIPEYYTLFGNSTWNTSLNTSSNEIVDETQKFLNYHVPPILKSHIDTYLKYEQPPPIVQSVVHIDTKIEKFADLITLIQTVDYKPYAKYNINLKALVQIREELLQLDKMVGMTEFKDAILNQLLYFVQDLHRGKDPDFMHTVLSGPPGTGKTEAATLLGKMYSKLGILKNGVFKKATRSDLIAGYLGQTAIKTAKVIQECLGGCLFIDEAYSLGSSTSGTIGGDPDSYSKECLDTLCEALSAHKEDLMVIVAGYEDELNKTFFNMNQGLHSRFIWRFTIDSYNSKELANIFQKKVQDNGWSFSPELETATILVKWIDKYLTTFSYFGRDMELLFSYTKIAHGRRIYGKIDQIHKQLNLADLDAGYKTFMVNKDKQSKASSIPYGLYV